MKTNKSSVQNAKSGQEESNLFKKIDVLEKKIDKLKASLVKEWVKVFLVPIVMAIIALASFIMQNEIILNSISDKTINEYKAKHLAEIQFDLLILLPNLKKQFYFRCKNAPIRNKLDSMLIVGTALTNSFTGLIKDTTNIYLVTDLINYIYSANDIIETDNKTLRSDNEEYYEKKWNKLYTEGENKYHFVLKRISNIE